MSDGDVCLGVYVVSMRGAWVLWSWEGWGGILQAAVGLRAAVVEEGLQPSRVAKPPWSATCMGCVEGPLSAASDRIEVLEVSGGCWEARSQFYGMYDIQGHVWAYWMALGLG